MADLKIRVRDKKNYKLVAGLLKWLENHIGEFAQAQLEALRNNPHANKIGAANNENVKAAITSGAEAFLVREYAEEKGEIYAIYSLSGLATGLNLPPGLLTRLERDSIGNWLNEELKERGIKNGVEVR
jgi:hypothetical protein